MSIHKNYPVVFLPIDYFISYYYVVCLFVCFSEFYVKDVELKATSREGEPRILKQSEATALVDGNKLLGMVETSHAYKDTVNSNANDQNLTRSQYSLSAIVILIVTHQ